MPRGFASSPLPTAAHRRSWGPRTTERRTTQHLRRTGDHETRADTPADPSTYFIARDGDDPGTHYVSPDADQGEGVIVDILQRQLPELVGDWRITYPSIEEIDP